MTTTKAEFGDAFISDFLRHFNDYSIRNKNYGLLILHTLLGQCLRNVYFRQKSRKIDIRIHGLFISPTGTGKGAGYGFYCRLAKDLGLDNQQLTESTDAGLAGTGRMLPDGRYEINEGLLVHADGISMEEASPLFDFSNDFSKKNLTYMQIAMNPLDDASCEITKKLGSLPDAIRFKPHCSFLLTTYIPDHFKEDLVKRGIVQRFTTDIENPSLEDRMIVIDRAIDGLNYSTEKNYDELYNSILVRFKEIVNRYQKVGGLVENEKKYDIDEEKLERITKKIAPTLNKKQVDRVCKLVKSEVAVLEKPIWKGFCFDINTTAKAELKHTVHELVEMIKDTTAIAQEKLAEFTHRMYEILVRLSIHHSILCLRTCVESEDVLYAKKVYEPIWKSLIYNIEELLVPTAEQRVKNSFIIHRSIDAYKRLLKENDKASVRDKVWVRRSKWLKDLQFAWDNCSKVTANNRAIRLETEVEDDTNKNKWFMKKKFGNTMYVKLIQDIG